MATTTYITTSIPYVNAPPHVGHALEIVQADALARAHRLIGHETTLQTGTDENAGKNVEAARELGISTLDLVDKNSELFRRLVEELDVSSHTFIRTTETRHANAVRRLFRQFDPEDLYQGEYEGLYCTGCEDFLTPSDLVNGRCPDHARKPERVSESNLFFRLSKYARSLEELLERGKIEIVPGGRLGEILSFVRSGLHDISVSRPSERVSGWGIPVPGLTGQVIYVWIDALINYLSGRGFGSSESWADTWNSDSLKIHVIGKNVWKFHAVYWPAMLLSAGVELPNRICVHGFLTADGQKISKSLGNSIDPTVYINRYGSDAVRLLLLSYPPASDGDFAEDRLRAAYTNLLADGVGNIASRVTALAERFEVSAADPGVGAGTGSSAAIEAAIQFRFHDTIRLLRERIDRLNRRINAEKVWEGKPECREASRRVVSGYVGELGTLARDLSVLVPEGAGKILNALATGRIRKLPPLYPRQ